MVPETRIGVSVPEVLIPWAEVLMPTLVAVMSRSVKVVSIPVLIFL